MTTQGEGTARQNYLVNTDEVKPGVRNVGSQPMLAIDINTDGNGFSNIQRFIEHKPDGFNSLLGAELAADEGQVAGQHMPHYFMLKYRLKQLCGNPTRVAILPDGRILREYRLPEFGKRIKRVPFSGLFGMEDDAVELLYGKIPQLSIESSRGGAVGGNITQHFNRVRRAQEMPTDEPQNAIFRVVGQDVGGPVTIGFFQNFDYLGQIEVAEDDDAATIEALIEALPGINGATVTMVESNSKAEGFVTINASPINTASISALLLNDGDGLVALDASSKDIDGTVAGATWEAGDYGSVLRFAGAGSINFGASAATRIVAQMTLFARIKTNVAGPHYLWSKSGADASFVMSINAANHLVLDIWSVAGVNTTITSPTPVLNDNVWHDLAATYDGSRVRLYVDGVQVREQAVAVLLRDTIADLVFGDLDTAGIAGNRFEGDADVLRIWNRALSLSEIGALTANPYEGFLVNGEEIKGQLNRVFDIEIIDPDESNIEIEWFAGENYEIEPVQFGSSGEGLVLVPGTFLEPDHVIRYKAKSKADLNSIKMGIGLAEGGAGPDLNDPHIIRKTQAGSISFDGMVAPTYYEDREKAPASHTDGEMNISASITLVKDNKGRCEEIYATDNREGGCGVTPWYYRQAYKCGAQEFWGDMWSIRNAQPDFPVENNQAQRQFPLVRAYNPNGSVILTLIHPATWDQAL